MSKKRCFTVTLRNWSPYTGAKGYGRTLSYKVWATNKSVAVARAFSKLSRDHRRGDCHTARVIGVKELSSLELLAEQSE
jgi:hypothetical protein